MLRLRILLEAVFNFGKNIAIKSVKKCFMIELPKSQNLLTAFQKNIQELNLLFSIN